MKQTSRILPLLLCAFLSTWPRAATAQRGNVRISLPKRSWETPVQKLNRDGVRDLKRGHVAKAKECFAKAYLIDPDDPFTLNNLGYVSELQGDADRALQYYQLAANTPTEAVISDASVDALKGHPVSAAFHSSEVSAYQRNRANFQAMGLLEKGRVFEAEAILRGAMHTDEKNPFLLDSLGYVMEAEGDLQGALQFYSAAASLHSDERVMLTPRKAMRGKAISEVAAHNASLVSQAIAKGEDTNARVARLNLRGVAALNHNDTSAAQKYFADAYRLDPDNAFTLNNAGYASELQGDRETAEMYYEAARNAGQANERVTYATRADAEGRKVGALAETNEGDVNAALKAAQARKRGSGQPIQLMLRDGSVAPSTPVPTEPLPAGVKTPALPPPQLPDRDTAPPSEQPSVPDPQPLERPPSPPAPPTTGHPF